MRVSVTTHLHAPLDRRRTGGIIRTLTSQGMLEGAREPFWQAAVHICNDFALPLEVLCPPSAGVGQ